MIPLFTWSFSTTAETTEIDNIAACAGVVIGNGAVDFYMGDEEAFDVAADIAYTAYLSIVFEGQYFLFLRCLLDSAPQYLRS